MNEDLFYSLDNAGFGSNVHEVAAEGECRVLRLDDDTGEGFMTMYRVAEGVYLMYNDFHLKSCISEYQNVETVLCIDHCREGRIEHENALGGHYYMEAGDLRIDRRVHHAGKVEMPLSHYHGITIGFISGLAEAALKREMPFIHLDLDALAEKFCADNKEFLLRTNEPFNQLFSQLYHAPKSIRRLDFYKVKIAELLLMLDTVDPTQYSEQRQYFPASQTDKVKEIHTLITGSLDKSFTAEELAKLSGMPPATLRKVFRAVYGTPIYQYIKSYKMKAAAAMLISERDMTIAEIAQRLGYDNASKFSAAFRDVMGVTPQSYRNRQEEL
ncbi:MAG: helix-turn-helix transcriptional regulator [Ruminococcus sp.]|nr:helix-turn-helix transcriptional regulator [Ruminococcus sp.]